METIGEKVQFFINTILSGGKVGAIAKSSDYVVEGVLKHVQGPLDTVVEYGPGDGVMTKAILKYLRPQGRLVAIESDPEFVKILREIGGPRVEIIEGNVEEVISHESWSIKDADLVLSSIPFSFLTFLERDRVVAKTYEMLRPHGSCIVFHQYSTLIKETLEKHFGTVTAEFEPRNVFPCFILVAKK